MAEDEVFVERDPEQPEDGRSHDGRVFLDYVSDVA